MLYDHFHEDEMARPRRRLPLGAMLRRLFALLAPERRKVAAGLALLFAGIAADVSGPLVLRLLVDRAIPRGTPAAIFGMAGLFLALFFAARAAQFAQVIFLTRAGLAAVTELKKRLFDHILSLSLDFHDRHSPGRLLARVESDAERLLALFSEVGAAFAGTLVVFFATLGLMFAADWHIAACVLALVLPLAVANVLYVRYLALFYAATRKTYAGLSAFLGEWLEAVPTIQVFGLERTAVERLSGHNRARIQSEMRAALREYPFWGVIQAAEVLVIAAILFFGSRALESGAGGGMSVGTLVLFVEYARRLFAPIMQFSEQLNFVQRAFAAGERVFEILDTPSRTPDRPGALSEVPRGWRELRFENVVFRYGEPGKAGSAPALDGVSFRLRRGERLAIVGVSGSGKTSLANLLLRYYDPTEGRISLDGTDIRAFRKSAWRARVGLILQEILLFPGTIRENLAVFSDPPPAPEAIARALEIVEAREFVERLPEGLDTDLAEGGTNLSLGERQLLSFARALVRDPDILILDEATSAVDPATERRLQRSLERLLEGRTAIIIAHRLATVRMADRIIVMHEGRIAEEGTHDALYAREGIYRDLCDLQLAPPRALAGASTPAEPGELGWEEAAR
jgi:ATP-binding cassette subfamily B protein